MQKHAPEGQTMSIKCSTGTINVLSASYGRKHSNEVCPTTSASTTPSTGYFELGPGHCVDANNLRPPHCYKYTTIKSEAVCRSICDRNPGCTAYEWGQIWYEKGPYCQLIHPAGGSKGVCPSGFLYTKTNAPNPVVKTFHDTNGGKCFVKRTAINCHAASSLSKVKQFCQGKSSCSVKSANTRFGDPCVGTRKCLTVQYECKGAKLSAGWAPKSRSDLDDVIKKCLQLSPTDCSEGPHGPIGSWDVSAVTDMSSLFDVDDVPTAEPFNGDISKWDVSQVTDMSSIFQRESSFNCDISEWVVSKVTDMNSMFNGAKSFNHDISKWHVSSVTEMSYMFADATAFNGDISKWDVSNVIGMFHMFDNAKSFNSDLSKWQVSNVDVMAHMFKGATSFTQQLSATAWVNSKATKDGMFAYSRGEILVFSPNSKKKLQKAIKVCLKKSSDCSKYPRGVIRSWDRGAIWSWDVSRVVDMSHLFDTDRIPAAASFNGDISTWDVSGVTDMSYMFKGATAFKGAIDAWDVSNVENMCSMFWGASAFNGDLKEWDVSEVTDMSYMFKDATTFNGTISAWDVLSVTTMSNMFNGATSFTQNLSKIWSISTEKNDVLTDDMFRGSSGQIVKEGKL